jgi:hypothetical protein
VVAVVALLLVAISLLGKTLIGGGGGGQVVAAATTFTADTYQAVAEVCDGRGMSNAQEWKPTKAQVFAFHTGATTPDAWVSVLVGQDASWAGKVNSYRKVSLVACLTADREAAVPKKRCVAKTADGNRAKVRVHRTTYALTLREAKTAKVLGDGQTIVVPGNVCPTLVRAAGNFFPPPSFVQADPAIETFLAAQGASKK